ncbi:hypothetical protein V496_04964 [Pseudogymnoascus sp. VKM F-4515 (FW-2607)]|nr:hypothetical protein V496_04964 [Pseudogymnoascus sp. VKM F-4515 (FW-2607)]
MASQWLDFVPAHVLADKNGLQKVVAPAIIWGTTGRWRRSKVHPAKPSRGDGDSNPPSSSSTTLRYTVTSAKMFTGIVEILGVVSSLSPSDASGGTTLVISNAAPVLIDCHDGDSISVNGTCLTVTAFTDSTFTVGVAPETLRRTNLGSLAQGDSVNLERAVSSHTRMGGHFVQGHVDTVATIDAKTPDGEAVTFRLRPRDKDVMKYIVEKGFVALDGASLTVTKVDDVEGWFEVMLIEYTQSRVVTAAKPVGGDVNVEVDMMGKYAAKSVEGYFEGGGVPVALQKLIEKIVEDKLAALQAK